MSRSRVASRDGSESGCSRLGCCELGESIASGEGAVGEGSEGDFGEGVIDPLAVGKEGDLGESGRLSDNFEGIAEVIVGE